MTNPMNDMPEEKIKNEVNLHVDQPNTHSGDQNGTRTFTEELTALGNQAVDQVKALVEKGNVRRLVVKDAETDRVLLDTSLTIGIGAGLGVFALAPFIALLATLAIAFTRVKIVIEREVV